MLGKANVVLSLHSKALVVKSGSRKDYLHVNGRVLPGVFVRADTLITQYFTEWLSLQ